MPAASMGGSERASLFAFVVVSTVSSIENALSAQVCVNPGAVLFLAASVCQQRDT